MRRELTKLARRGGASAPRPNFCFGPRTLILKKNTWNFLRFFFEPTNFFMNAAPNCGGHIILSSFYCLVVIMESLKPIPYIFLLKKPYLGNPNGIVIDCLEEVNELSYLNQIWF
jgi:hypothetical protein